MQNHLLMYRCEYFWYDANIVLWYIKRVLIANYYCEWIYLIIHSINTHTIIITVGGYQ